MVKEFVKAILENNRVNAEQLLYTKSSIDTIYSDENIRKNYIRLFKNITSWKQIDNSISRAPCN